MYTSMYKKAVFKLHFAVIVSIYAERSVTLLGLTPLHMRKICGMCFVLPGRCGSNLRGIKYESAYFFGLCCPAFMEYRLVFEKANLPFASAIL